MIADKEKGASLIITFFIMIIILAVVLSISTLLYSEVKIIRNIGNSMIAFFAADSGIEKFLYYDRQVIPDGASRGLCSICTTCPESGFDSCANCTPSSDCTTTCGGACAISFSTTFNDKTYKISASILAPSQEQCISQGNVESYGTYNNTNATRAIQLDIAREVKTGIGPGVSDNGTTFRANQYEEVIHIHVSAPEDLASIKAYIFYSPTDPANGGTYALDTHLPNPVDLSYNSGQDEWQGNWNAHETGWFYVSIGAIDANGYCTSITINP